jgi:hypothetical protein
MYEIQFVPNTKHNKSPLQRTVGKGGLQKQLLFAVRTTGNTKIQSVGRMQSFRIVTCQIINKLP